LQQLRHFENASNPGTAKPALPAFSKRELFAHLKLATGRFHNASLCHGIASSKQQQRVDFALKPRGIFAQLDHDRPAIVGIDNPNAIGKPNVTLKAMPRPTENQHGVPVRYFKGQPGIANNGLMIARYFDRVQIKAASAVGGVARHNSRCVGFLDA